ncbi:MAG TPA: hypothetical protein VLA28_04090 [Afifellaceae bacterium]|nr:hypothetical protein [Afifellaceae bacterium]
MPANGNGQHLDAEDIAGAAGDEQKKVKVRQQASCRRLEHIAAGSGSVFDWPAPFVAALPRTPANATAYAFLGHEDTGFAMPALAWQRGFARSRNARHPTAAPLEG